jgi:hypothetical protein
MAAKLDRVSEIIEHESIAEGEEHVTSYHRWAAAELIWQEVTEGKSRRELGREIGKSHTHVRYMFNCWDTVGQKLGLSYDQLPNFNTVYNSPEIRGDIDGDGDTGQKRRNDHEGEDHSAHGIIMAMATLVGQPAYIDLITDDDWVILGELPGQIRRFLRDAGR